MNLTRRHSLKLIGAATGALAFPPGTAFAAQTKGGMVEKIPAAGMGR